jgi:hypothetical protein
MTLCMYLLVCIIAPITFDTSKIIDIYLSISTVAFQYFNLHKQVAIMNRGTNYSNEGPSAVLSVITIRPCCCTPALAYGQRSSRP